MILYLFIKVWIATYAIVGAKCWEFLSWYLLKNIARWVNDGVSRYSGGFKHNGSEVVKHIWSVSNKLGAVNFAEGICFLILIWFVES